MSVVIFDVEKGSIADKKGIKPGDSLVSIGKNEIFDVLDFRFWQQSTRLVLHTIDTKGKKHTIRVVAKDNCGNKTSWEGEFIR